MQLLSPTNIQKDQRVGAEESRQRSNALALEESRLAKSINQARQAAEAEIVATEKDVREAKEKARLEMDEITRSLEALRATRDHLMKPVDELLDRARQIMAEAEEGARAVDERVKQVQNEHDINVKRAENIADTAERLNAHEQDLDAREGQIKREERRQQESARTLGDEWAKLTLAVTVHNGNVRELEQRERRATITEEANQVRHIEQNKRDHELSQKQVAVRDGYEQLEKARAEILGRIT